MATSRMFGQFANSNCDQNSTKCASGCCHYYKRCATDQSQCYWVYKDYYKNDNYYYQIQSNTFNKYSHPKCNSDSRNCVTGCCTKQGACAKSPKSCFYQYHNYAVNRTYYYPGMSPFAESPLGARNCTSGCGSSNGYCANSTAQCAHLYQDRTIRFYDMNQYHYLNGDSDQMFGNLLCKGDLCGERLIGFLIFVSVFAYSLLAALAVFLCWWRRKHADLVIENKYDTVRQVQTVLFDNKLGNQVNKEKLINAKKENQTNKQKIRGLNIN